MKCLLRKYCLLGFLLKYFETKKELLKGRGCLKHISLARRDFYCLILRKTHRNHKFLQVVMQTHE